MTWLVAFIHSFNLVGAVLGLLSNLLLIFAIYMTSRGRFHPYSQMFLVASVFDIFFSAFEILTQNQVAVKGGLILVLCHGIEKIAPQWVTIWIILPMHTSIIMHGVLILPVLYRFRYLIISRPSVSFSSLLKSLSISMGCSMIVGLLCGVAAWPSTKKPREYYLESFTPSWRLENENYFMYGGEKNESGTLAAAIFAFVFTIIAIFLILYYFIAAYKFINRSAVTHSQRTKSLQTQFTWILVAQSANAIIFSFFPLLLVTMGVLMELDVELIGVAIMTPLSWLPAANALLTLFVIKNYRLFLMEIMCKNKTNIASGWTNSKSNTMNPPHATPIIPL